jgi:hypothetical protein
MAETAFTPPELHDLRRKVAFDVSRDEGGRL